MQLIKVAFDERELKRIEKAADKLGMKRDSFIRVAASTEAALIVENENLEGGDEE